MRGNAWALSKCASGDQTKVVASVFVFSSRSLISTRYSASVFSYALTQIETCSVLLALRVAS